MYLGFLRQPLLIRSWLRWMRVYCICVLPLPPRPHICIYHQLFWEDFVPSSCLGDRARLSPGHGGIVSHDESDDGAAETVSAGYAGRAKVGLDLSMHDSRAEWPRELVPQCTQYSGYVMYVPNADESIQIFNFKIVTFLLFSSISLNINFFFLRNMSFQV